MPAPNKSLSGNIGCDDVTVSLQIIPPAALQFTYKNIPQRLSYWYSIKDGLRDGVEIRSFIARKINSTIPASFALGGGWGSVYQ